jgi:hypothetical protein
MGCSRARAKLAALILVNDKARAQDRDAAVFSDLISAIPSGKTIR